jgi:hypothetical protein
MRLSAIVLALLVTVSAHAQLESDPAFGLSTDFRNWLTANGYSSYGFERSDVPGGSYGGRAFAGQAVVRQPVIFIHGNSDSAIGTGSSSFTGWRASIEYFKSQGYTSAELYATTWGPANSLLASQQYHSKAYLTRLRAFVTGDADERIDPRRERAAEVVAAAVGGIVAGANRGLVACYQTGPVTPTCGSTNGFYPGYLIGGFGPYGVSAGAAFDRLAHQRDAHRR